MGIRLNRWGEGRKKKSSPTCFYSVEVYTGVASGARQGRALNWDHFSLHELVFSFQGLWENIAGITEIKNVGLQIRRAG